MAWVVAQQDGTEWTFNQCPYKSRTFCGWCYKCNINGHFVELPKGSIQKLIGRKLTWEDEPIELKEDKK